MNELYTHITDEKKLPTFITGIPGSGKSYQLHYILNNNILQNKVIAKTASTGIAASHIKGITIHNFAGIGDGSASVDEIYQKHINKKDYEQSYLYKRWNKTDVLIIDEISQIDCYVFDKIEELARRFRRKPNLFFGGIQLIVVGDFAQLPPIATLKNNPKQKAYAFLSETWKKNIQREHIFLLTQSYRQEENSPFYNMLNDIRLDNISDQLLKMLNTRVNKKFDNYINDENCIEIYSKRDSVKLCNDKVYRKLSSKEYIFASEAEGDMIYKDLLRTQYQIPNELKLKIGTQVILTKNIDQSQGLVNGLRGTIVRFIDKYFKEDQKQEPTPQLEYSTYDEDLISFQSERVTRKIIPLYPITPFSHKTWRPVIVFEKDDYELNPIEIMVDKYTWTIEEEPGDIKAKQTQLPLDYAYGLTVHKCQGMTLNNVKIQPLDFFEDGQMYTALSRARSLENISLFSPIMRSHIKTSKLIVDFYKYLIAVPRINKNIRNMYHTIEKTPDSVTKYFNTVTNNNNNHIIHKRKIITSEKRLNNKQTVINLIENDDNNNNNIKKQKY